MQRYKENSTAKNWRLSGLLTATTSLCVLASCQVVEPGTDPVAGEDTATQAATAVEAETPGTEEVASSDRNHITALLMQWWEIFEAPPSVDRAGLINQIFAKDAVIHMEAGNLSGLDAIRAGIDALPATAGRSHHLTELAVTPKGKGLYALDATFRYQIAMIDGTLEAGNSAYHHTVRKLPDGQFVLTEIKAELLESLPDATFEPSYETNRARAALAYYLGTTDVLQPDYPDLRAVLTDDAEVHGMFDPAKQRFNERDDGVLIGYDEISSWLASRGDRFDSVGHEITSLDVSSMGGNRYAITAEIATSAQPKSGDPINVLLPIKLVMVDTGETLMKINRISR